MVIYDDDADERDDNNNDGSSNGNENQNEFPDSLNIKFKDTDIHIVERAVDRRTKVTLH